MIRSAKQQLLHISQIRIQTQQRALLLAAKKKTLEYYLQHLKDNISASSQCKIEQACKMQTYLRVTVYFGGRCHVHGCTAKQTSEGVIKQSRERPHRRQVNMARCSALSACQVPTYSLICIDTPPTHVAAKVSLSSRCWRFFHNICPALTNRCARILHIWYPCAGILPTYYGFLIIQ